jgi:hypothetical protein
MEAHLTGGDFDHGGGGAWAGMGIITLGVGPQPARNAEVLRGASGVATS